MLLKKSFAVRGKSMKAGKCCRVRVLTNTLESLSGHSQQLQKEKQARRCGWACLVHSDEIGALGR
jgi:hypothetical protein